MLGGGIELMTKTIKRLHDFLIGKTKMKEEFLMKIPSLCT